jgi:(3S)-malyl-CoA thioesterase
MNLTNRPLRSALYLPASNARALDKARSLPCDALIFDLEDAVAPAAKEAARDALRAALEQGGYGQRLRLVRVNGRGSAGFDQDCALAGLADGLVIPKVNQATDLNGIDAPLWPMLETPSGILNAASIAAHPKVQGLIVGTNDLLKDLRAKATTDRLALLPSLGLAVLAARAAGKVVLDGVLNGLDDPAALQAECEQGRTLGFDGKTLIHPAQIATANAVFGPSAAEIDEAQALIDAHDQAMAQGQAVAVHQGRIVEALHVAEATRLLLLAKTIAAADR